MKFGLLKVFALVSIVPLAVALNACGDDSSTSGSSDGSNRGGIPDTVETFMELSDYDCGKSQKCVATYLTEYHDMAVCDGNNGWVIGTLIEKMDCDFSSSSDKSSDSKSNDPAGVTDDSSDSKDEAISSSSSSNSSSSGPAAGTLTYGGQTYRTVVIGAQTWMAENLNYEYKVNGSTYGNWCYNDSALYCERYGRLYTWAAAMDSATTGCGYGATCETDAGAVQGICPDGWHLPSRAEWDTLIAFVGGEDVAGRRLRSISGWYDNANGDDGYGFSALPSGIRHGNGGFNNAGQNANFWSSSESSPDSSSQMYMYYTVRSAGLVDNAKNKAFSVRCVKD
ncbi:MULTISPECIES: fibrobacter succinogenes major paralogous domain-containing protein [unclassified Fibrobacter]|uniref:fibrobacter succinogenes major paralogous domain-containing protein n=1 Tax=unclassified Fibrobacter TaxID=2634177 RepID=UPI000D6CF76E|nr:MULTISPECIES: fibrobacter succinogenes major paralogous domain-containing protein [unclassified Fibrobacter]PWJ53387.1 uncharacterized protein (TIGR02145 family) [Fibrobacter sp. UWR4]PZW62329.1 uncharacterized protein (TIGR02145 family) [Fibrobacter sp. UWR1]